MHATCKYKADAIWFEHRVPNNMWPCNVVVRYISASNDTTFSHRDVGHVCYRCILTRVQLPCQKRVRCGSVEGPQPVD